MTKASRACPDCHKSDDGAPGFGCVMPSTHALAHGHGYERPMTPRMLTVLSAVGDRPQTPNEIGEGAGVRFGDLSRQGKVMGKGSAIAPTLTALRQRGLVARARRRDGQSGTAYVLTDKGRLAVHHHKGARS